MYDPTMSALYMLEMDREPEYPEDGQAVDENHVKAEVFEK